MLIWAVKSKIEVGAARMKDEGSLSYFEINKSSFLAT